MFTDHGEFKMDEHEVRENVSSAQLSGQSRQSDMGEEPKMGGGSTYGISHQVLTPVFRRSRDGRQLKDWGWLNHAASQ